MSAVDVEFDVLREAFIEAATPLLKVCGGDLDVSLPKSRQVDLYLDYLGCLHVEFALRFKKRPIFIRLEVVKADSLMVGWAGNNLLTTNNSDFDDEQIFTVLFVAEVFKHEAEWREVLLGLDCGGVRAALAAEEQAKQLAKQALEAENLSVYAASVKVGTVLVGRFGEFQVLRESKTRVQVGKELYSKVEVGAKLKSGEWRVKEASE